MYNFLVSPLIKYAYVSYKITPYALVGTEQETIALYATQGGKSRIVKRR